MRPYSYHIISVNWQKGIVYNSTGFFIEKKNRLFFVTAAHAVSGWNSMQGNQNPDQPDFAEIILSRKIDNKLGFFNIDLKPFKVQFAGKQLTDHVDVAVIEIDPLLKEKYQIHGIEKFLGTAELLTDQMFSICGYKNSYPKGIGFIHVIEAPGDEASMEFTKKIDINDNFYEAKTVTNVISPGFSGAPVFSISNDVVHFNGVCIGGELGSNLQPKLLVARPEAVNKLIDERIKQKPVIVNPIVSEFFSWAVQNGYENKVR
jgi:hypothetical protein